MVQSEINIGGVTLSYTGNKILGIENRCYEVSTVTQQVKPLTAMTGSNIRALV